MFKPIVLLVVLCFMHQVQTFLCKCRVLQVLPECYCIFAFEQKPDLNRFCHFIYRVMDCFIGIFTGIFMKSLVGNDPDRISGID